MVPADVSRVTLRRNGCCSPVWTGTRRGGNAAPTGSTSVGGRIITTNCRLRLRPPPRRAASVRRPQVPVGASRRLISSITYEFTRWFSDRLLWNTVPGDVTTVPDVPSIVKSRPICGDNANSVLLNLDKVRHFIFLRDDIPFRKKSDKAIFRLAITRRPHRERFMRMYFGSECCDAGISTPRPEYPPEWTKPHISMYDHLNYKSFRRSRATTWRRTSSGSCRRTRWP